MAVVGKNGKYGIVNTIGEFVLEMCFDGLKAFESDKYAPAKLGDKWGYINKSGQYIVNPQYDDATDFFDDGYTMVLKSADDYSGYTIQIITDTGKIIYTVVFEG